MAYVSQNRSDIEGKLKTYFQLAGLNNLLPGTPEHALWQILTDNLFQLYTDLESSYSDKLPLNATGGTLDLWTNFFSVNRKPSQYALDTTTTNVHFFISESNRATVNEGSELTIPEGTIVSVGGVRRFNTTASTVIPGLGNPPYVGYVPVRATETGTYNNIEENEIDTHNLEDLLPEVAGIDAIEVTNTFAISTGQFPQLDSSLQDELQNVFGKQIATNLEGILTQVRSMAGVADVQVLESKRGTGTFSLFVDSVSPIISLGLITQIQEAVDTIKPVGTMGYVEYPRYKAIKIEFEITPQDGSTADEAIASLSSTTTPNMVSIVNNLERGGSVNIENLLAMVISNSAVKLATIKDLRIGEYSVTQNKLINSEVVGTGVKESEWDEKWFVSSDLVSYCTREDS